MCSSWARVGTAANKPRIRARRGRKSPRVILHLLSSPNTLAKILGEGEEKDCRHRRTRINATSSAFRWLVGSRGTHRAGGRRGWHEATPLPIRARGTIRE